MSRNTKSALIGKWRIVEMELQLTTALTQFSNQSQRRRRAHTGVTAIRALVEPAYIRFDPRGAGEFVFGTVTGGLDYRHIGEGADFTWQGNAEMDEASGSGWTKLNDDGSLGGEIKFHLGDRSAFKARKW